MAYRYVGRQGGRPGMGRGGGRYTPRRRVCSFCVDKVKKIDYKDSAKLSRYISDRGKIEPRRKTGTCARHQRALAMAIKRARLIALLPFVAEHIRSAGNVASLKPAAVMPKVATPAVVEEAAKAPAEPATEATKPKDSPETEEPATKATKPKDSPETEEPTAAA